MITYTLVVLLAVIILLGVFVYTENKEAGVLPLIAIGFALIIGITTIVRVNEPTTITTTEPIPVEVFTTITIQNGDTTVVNTYTYKFEE